MQHLKLVCQLLLGLLFLVFGANKLLQFAAVPPPPGDAGLYYSLLFRHHIMSAVAIVEMSGGALLLSGRYVPLALVLLGPVIINILLYHFFFDATHMPIGIAAAVLEVVLLWLHRRAFSPLLVPVLTA